MSDIFRLLSRSTKLQKTENPSSTRSNCKLPSAGVPIRPNIFPIQEQSSKLQEDKRGKKRKRGRPSLQEDNDEEGPYFFGGVDPAVSQNEPAQSEQELHETSLVDVPARILQGTSKVMSVDERKRILRSHKLKISIMNPADETSRSETEQKVVSHGKKRRGPFPIFPVPLLSFQDLRSKYRVSKRLAGNIQAQGYTTPTEVQIVCLPILLGTHEEIGTSELTSMPCTKPSLVNLLAIAPTGSGKTLAFLVPIIQHLQQDYHSQPGLSLNPRKSSYVRSIIVVPTHELMNQIVNEARKLVRGTGLKVTAMRKGMRLAQATDAIECDSEIAMETVVKSDILVSTPLMLVNSLNETSISREGLPSIQSLVLDEADILLDSLFREQTLQIWKSCTNPDLRISLWSATIGASIEHLAQQTISERRELLGLNDAQALTVRVIAGLKDSALPTISHNLVYGASEQGKLLAMRQLLRPNILDSQVATLRPPFIVFTQTISRANALYSELLYDIPVEAGGSKRIAVLHSSLSDTTRSNIMSDFRKGDTWVLITTDLLARGVDFRGVNGVVNYDIPNTAAAYVHRAGRTGRAGREGGISVTLYTKDDIPYVKNIANVIAASERAQGKPRAESGLQKWLLDALPDVSKKTKKELKRRGVATRRPAHGLDDKSQEIRRSRISTKSGFDRRKENNKKDAVAASKSRLSNQHLRLDGSGSEDEWEGLD